MSWFLVILFLSLSFGGSFSNASHHKTKLLPSAVVVGTVYCDACFQQAFSKGSHFISGASVAVECKVESSKPRFYKEVKTDEHGEFKVKLPFTVRKHVKIIKGCTFKLKSSSDPHCSVASTSTAVTSSLSLKKKVQGEHIFSAGFFSFKPTKKPNFCDRKHTSIPNSMEHSYVKSSEKSQLSNKVVPDPVKTFFPPIPFFPPPIIPIPFLPPPLIPNPFQPPPLIPNPFQPPSPPLIPNPFQPPSPPLIPNPFQPPPSNPPLIPNPFQPPPSNPPLIPNPFQPPPSSPPPLIPNPFQPPPSTSPPSFPFPPIVIPGLTPSPPPPPPPKSVFPFPFPPLFPPPHSPGTPPAASSKHSSP